MPKIMLSWSDLPPEVSLWPRLPIVLNNARIIPVEYPLGENSWVLYGRQLDKDKLTAYQHKLGIALIIIKAWFVKDYQVIQFSGFLTQWMICIAHEAGFDVAQLRNVPFLNIPGLLVMDMDSTAVNIECIDELAILNGNDKAVLEITNRAMQGELDFTSSLRQRVALLKGADTNILKIVRDKIPLMSGLTYLITELQARSWKTAIISGGFTYYAEYLRDILNLSAVAANVLEISNGKLTGKLVGNIVDAQYKAYKLRKLAQQFKINLSQTVAIGDGANDIPMIETSALGIAYHAKQKVNEKSKVIICHADLIGVLCILSSSMPSIY